MAPTEVWNCFAMLVSVSPRLHDVGGRRCGRGGRRGRRASERGMAPRRSGAPSRARNRFQSSMPQPSARLMVTETRRSPIVPRDGRSLRPAVALAAQAGAAVLGGDRGDGALPRQRARRLRDLSQVSGAVGVALTLERGVRRDEDRRDRTRVRARWSDARAHRPRAVHLRRKRGTIATSATSERHTDHRIAAGRRRDRGAATARRGGRAPRPSR